MSPDAFVQFLWTDVQAQMVIEQADTGEPLGLVQLIGSDPRSRFAYLSVLLSPRAMGLGWPLEGVFLFVDYSFRSFNIRKLYFESLDFVAKDYESAVGRFMVHESTLPKHHYHDGEYWDVQIFALYREAWSKLSDEVLGSIRRPGEER